MHRLIKTLGILLVAAPALAQDGQPISASARKQVVEVLTGVLSDPAVDRILRMRAALCLMNFPDDRSVDALEAVLLSEKEQDRILQRNCLYSLGQMEPADKEVARRYLERLKKVLLDRRVYGNPYFAIRVDVATALSAMNVREPVVFDLMCEYLVDEDKDDKEHLVRQEGFLTLWALTGAKLPEVPADLFQIPPLPFPDPLAAREFFFRRAHHRPGIKQEQSKWVAKVSADLALMQKLRDGYQALKAKILEKWRKEAEARPQPEEKGPGDEGTKPKGK